MVEIVEMYVIAKTTPFVIQPAENALVHPAFWAKSKWFFFLRFLWKITIKTKIVRKSKNFILFLYEPDVNVLKL